MKFRTEIEPLRTDITIAHSDAVVMLGSCFTDNISALMLRDGFNVVANPMGVLYNPVSIANLICRATENRLYCLEDLVQTPDGIWHCLDYNTHYQNADKEALLAALNVDLTAFAEALQRASIVIITLGTAYVYTHLQTANTVGNCHKIPAREFSRNRLSLAEATDCITRICDMLKGKRVIFTVSPIRHLADGLHGNNLSKAILHLGIDAAGADYFPAYEALCDDLRDYRFYANDLKHPAEMAVTYIYELFAQSYFSQDTQAQALAFRAAAARKAHRPIL